MVNMHNKKNMNYCSEYDSEQTYEANLSDSEYDSGKDFYDDEYTKSTGVDVGKYLSEAWQVCRSSPPPFQSTSLKTLEETGCETMEEYKEHLQREAEEERNQIKMEEMKKAKEEFKEREAKKKQWEDIMKNLPTESKAGRMKRLREEREKRNKMNWTRKKAIKKKKKTMKSLPFGHRRNGGGKGRKRMIKRGSLEEKRAIEVVKKRRSLRRRDGKFLKKEAEEKRQKEFELLKLRPKPSKTIVVNHIEEIPDEDEEKEAEREAEIKAEKEEQQKILQKMRKKAIRSTLMEMLKSKQEDHKKRIDCEEKQKKMNEERKEKKLEIEDVQKNGEWSKVEKKKKKKSSGKKLKIKLPVLIKLTTTKQITEEKRVEGMSDLADTSKMKKSLLRTKMCNSVGSGKHCRHGKHCRFAHSVEELQVGECFFKDACNRVRKTEHGYRNCSRRTCPFLHPEESMDEYCQRLGLEKKKKVVERKVVERKVVERKVVERKVVERKVVEKKVVERKVVEKKVLVNPWKVEKKVAKEIDIDQIVAESLRPIDDDEWQEVKYKSRSRKSRWGPKKTTPKKERKNILCESVGSGKPCRHGSKCRFKHETDRVVLRVPKCLALQAFELALKSGKQNIVVEIV